MIKFLNIRVLPLFLSFFLSFFLSLWSPLFAKSYTLEEVYEYASKNHPKGKILKSRVNEMGLGISKIKSDYLPELNAVVGAERRQAQSNNPINGNRFVAELRLKYNLFRFNKTGDQVKALESLLNKEEESYSWWQENLYRQINAQYTICQALKEKTVIINNELLENKSLKRSVSKRRKSGLIGKSDFLDVELREDQLLAQLTDISEELDHSMDKLRKLTFLKHSDTVVISGKIPHHHFHLNLKTLISKAKERNQKIKESKLIQASHLEDLRRADKNYFPEVNLSGRFGRMRYDEQYTNRVNQNEGLIGVYVDIPIFDGGNRKSTRQIYQEKYQQKLLNTELLKNNEIIELTHKYELLEKIHSKVDLLEKSSLRGKKYFKDVLSEYNRGVKNSLDLVSSRDRLLNLSLNLLEAKTKYVLTTLNIEELTGERLQEKL